MKAPAAILVLLCSHYLEQAETSGANDTPTPRTLYVTNRSNLVSISSAVKIASGLRVGMPATDVHKYMENHGITQTNIYSISLDRGRTLTWPYPLAGDTKLMLDMHCTKAPPGLLGWSNPVLDRAYIQNQGAGIISITLTNAP